MENRYYYDGLHGELTPEECKEYFLESPISDWIVDEDGFWGFVWGSKVYFAIRVESDEDGHQVLYYNDCPVAKVCITQGARGIWKSIPFDLVKSEE
jgi:hypothetical protein